MSTAAATAVTAAVTTAAAAATSTATAALTSGASISTVGAVDTDSLRCLDSTHPANCTTCRPPPILGDIDLHELVGDPGKKNGEKKLRLLLRSCEEWANDEMRERAAETAIAAGLAHLAPAIREKQVPALRKGHLLFLANVWNFKSEIWRRKPQHLHAQLRQRRQSRCRTSVFQPTAKRAVPLPGEISTSNATASTVVGQEGSTGCKDDTPRSLITACESAVPLKKQRLNGVKDMHIKHEENGVALPPKLKTTEELQVIRDPLMERCLLNGRDSTPQSIYAARLSSSLLHGNNANLPVPPAVAPHQPVPQQMSRARFREEIDNALAPLAETFLRTNIASEEFKQMVDALWNKNGSPVSAFAELTNGILATHAARIKQLRAEIRLLYPRDELGKPLVTALDLPAAVYIVHNRSCPVSAAATEIHSDFQPLTTHKGMMLLKVLLQDLRLVGLSQLALETEQACTQFVSSCGVAKPKPGSLAECLTVGLNTAMSLMTTIQSMAGASLCGTLRDYLQASVALQEFLSSFIESLIVLYQEFRFKSPRHLRSNSHDAPAGRSGDDCCPRVHANDSTSSTRNGSYRQGDVLDML